MHSQHKLVHLVTRIKHKQISFLSIKESFLQNGSISGQKFPAITILNKVMLCLVEGKRKEKKIIEKVIKYYSHVSLNTNLEGIQFNLDTNNTQGTTK